MTVQFLNTFSESGKFMYVPNYSELSYIRQHCEILLRIRGHEVCRIFSIDIRVCLDHTWVGSLLGSKHVFRPDPLVELLRGEVAELGSGIFESGAFLVRGLGDLSSLGMRHVLRNGFLKICMMTQYSFYCTCKT